MIILCYHNIVGDALDDFDRVGEIRVHRRAFAEDMRALSRRWTVITLDSLVKALEEERELPDACAITFDDGYRGVMHHAVPVLQALGIPATLFLTTSLPDGEIADFDATEIAFRLTHRPTIDLRALGLGVLPLQTPTECARAMRTVKKKLRHLPYQEACEWRTSVSKALDVSASDIRAYARTDERYAYLSWDNVKTLLRRGWTVGAHTRTHPSLPTLPNPEAVRKEIAASVHDIYAHLSAVCRHFAYPYGHVSPAVRSVVASLRFRSAVTVEKGWNRVGVDRLLLYRMNIGDLKSSPPPYIPTTTDQTLKT